MLSRNGIEEDLQTPKLAGTTEVTGCVQNNEVMGDAAHWGTLCKGGSCRSASTD